jgi:diacylglycerol O-acyltransferase
MTESQDSDRLSWGDALFLYLERKGMPLNIASVSVFEGEISLEDVTRFIESKLPLVPRCYQRVMVPPLNIALPSWEYDPNFDIRNHIREVTLTRGTEAELKMVAGRILSTVMDRQRPLWDFTLLHGLHGNRTGLLTRLHHCLADGIAGLGVMNVLLDPTPQPRSFPRKRRPRHPQRQHDPLTRLLEGCINTYSDVIQRTLMTQSDILNTSQRILAADGRTAEQFAQFLPELTAPTERLWFNVTYQGPQKFAWAQIPTAEIKSIRERCGGTHNDVILALVAATIRSYAEMHGDRMKKRLLRMMVPVSVRDDDHADELGTRISLLPVTVPLGIRNPTRLLAAVQKRTEFLKHARIADLVGLAGGLIGTTPVPLQALLGPVASLLPITPFNLVCTNVKGPQFPLYLLGHKMLDWYPYVPIGGEMTVNCAVLSYNSITYFGFSGDLHAAPDLARLEPLLRRSFLELRRAAGISSPIRRKIVRAETMPAPPQFTQRSSGFAPVPATASPSAPPAASGEELQAAPPVHAPISNAA